MEIERACSILYIRNYQEDLVMGKEQKQKKEVKKKPAKTDKEKKAAKAEKKAASKNR